MELAAIAVVGFIIFIGWRIVKSNEDRAEGDNEGGHRKGGGDQPPKNKS